MPSKIWDKYKKIQEIESNSNIKTYLARMEPIIKEITPQNEEDNYIICERLEKLKEELNIYEIIEENEKIYIVMDNNDELLLKIDTLILSDELNIKKEVIIKDHVGPITKDEIFNLFKMEKSMCKISFDTIDGKKGKGSGFFCEIDIDFPFKYALFTNNHVLDESNIEVDKTIHFECVEFKKKKLFNCSNIKKEIKITNKRRVFTNKELEYTCIELFESDKIIDYFKIDSKLFKYDKKNLKNNDIFILQYPNGNDLSFSCGKILSLKDNIIIHNASTDEGSSGSPIIRRSIDNLIIGLHRGGYVNNKKSEKNEKHEKNEKDEKNEKNEKNEKKKNECKFNIATSFYSILYNIKQQYNEINCIYIPYKNKYEINLLHDYNLNLNNWNENKKKEYLNVKKINTKIFEKYIEIYVNDKKINFDYKYNIKDSKEIKVKFKFKTLLTDTSYMFCECPSLKSIDLSSFNTTNVNNMSYMFSYCSSLESIDLTSINSINVNNMSYMFASCSSLKSIDLSSVKATNVNNMSYIFYSCSSLISIDLSSFEAPNINDISGMFSGCSSLELIDLSSFSITNVNNMSNMFYDCSSLKSIDLSSFNATRVNNMSMSNMFFGCSSLKKENIRINNKNVDLLKKIEEDLK